MMTLYHLFFCVKYLINTFVKIISFQLYYLKIYCKSFAVKKLTVMKMFKLAESIIRYTDTRK